MSGLGQNIHLLHCAGAVHARGGSDADWGATTHLQWYWCQSVGEQPRTVKTIKSGCMELIHSKWRDSQTFKHNKYHRQLKKNIVEVDFDTEV